MNCPYCAESIPDDIRFCPKCGTEMGSPLPDSPAFRAPLPPGFQPPTSGKAIGSLICGIFFLFLPASIIAVILGHLSVSEIRKSAGRLKGQGIATAGLVLGYIGIAFIPFILIVAAIAIPNLLRARMAANEASAVGDLRSFQYALGTYAAQCPQIGFPASLSNLGFAANTGSHPCDHAGLVDNNMGREYPIRFGYTFHYAVGLPDGTGKTTSFALSAEPVRTGNTGSRSFFVDQTGVVRVSSFGPANIDSPPL
jgi:type IV pilus assembly protein PilA